MHITAKIWTKQPGTWFCISTRTITKKWEDHFFRRSEFDEIPDFIEENLDKDVYWCPHGFTKPRRLKEFAVIPKLLWADLDEVNPSDLKSLMPTIAWQSSPGRFAALWDIDAFMTEDLNRRLTYKIGADKGGWDVTQVLRVPGTFNYKYGSKPKVKLLWSDGPKYASANIEKQLPKFKDTDVDHDNSDALGIYKKYERKFNTFIRKELLRGKPVKGRRSEVFWKLANELMEAGCSTGEIFELLRVSPWNKFKGRRDADKQLKREVEKALSQHLNVSINGKPTFELEDDEDEPEEHKFLSISMAEVEEENIDWLWYPYLARGEMTILEGDPGLGKSYLAQMIAKAVCDGDTLDSPKKKPLKPGRVAYFDVENSMGSVTRKRLTENGCQNLHNFFQDAYPFSVDDDETLDKVHEALAKLKPTLVVFDTINIYVGGADTHKASETQQMLARFVEIGRRHNCAVMVLRHLTKSSKEKAIYRGQGSISFAGLARIVLSVGKVPEDMDPEGDIRAVAVTKINIGKPPMALTFKIEALKDTLKSTDRSKFHWGEYVDLTADDIMSVTAPSKKDKPKQNEARKMLEQLLEGGPMPVAKILRAAESRSISNKAVYKAAEEMGIIDAARSAGKKRANSWFLPDDYKPAD